MDVPSAPTLKYGRPCTRPKVHWYEHQSTSCPCASILLVGGFSEGSGGGSGEGSGGRSGSGPSGPAGSFAGSFAGSGGGSTSALGSGTSPTASCRLSVQPSECVRERPPQQRHMPPSGNSRASIPGTSIHLAVERGAAGDRLRWGWEWLGAGGVGR